MLTLPSRILLFVSSFSPLFAIWGVRLIPSPISVVPFAASAIGIAGTLIVLYAKRLEEGRVDRVESVKPRDTEAAAYLVTYVVPLALPTTDWRDWVAVLLFLSIVAALYLRSGMDYINPTLALMGYHLYEAQLRDDRLVWLVTRMRIAPGDEVNTVNLISGIWFAKSKVNGSR
jgi:hypothetical protein